ncbi:MAG: hypothetical protein ACI4MQ_06095 [Candidatus Coproplasma sp.]
MDKTKQLILADLNKLNLTQTDAVFRCEVPGGGAVGAIISTATTQFCCLGENCLHFFKIKQVFSYKGINTESIQTIRFEDILDFYYDPSSPFHLGHFVLKHKGGTINKYLTNTTGNEEDFNVIYNKFLQYKEGNC